MFVWLIAALIIWNAGSFCFIIFSAVRKELLVEYQQDETARINNKKLNDDYQKLLSENVNISMVQLIKLYI